MIKISRTEVNKGGKRIRTKEEEDFFITAKIQLHHPPVVVEQPTVGVQSKGCWTTVRARSYPCHCCSLYNVHQPSCEVRQQQGG